MTATSFRVMRADLDRVLSFIDDHPTIVPPPGHVTIDITNGYQSRVLIHCVMPEEFDASVSLLREAGGVERFETELYLKARRQFGTVALELQTPPPRAAVSVVSDRFATHETTGDAA